MANEEKLLNLVNVIGAAKDRGEWNQQFWGRQNDCGTTMCAAGWQCVIEGQTLDYVGSFDKVAEKTTSGEEIEDFAAKSLELTYNEAVALFHGIDTDYDELVATVKQIINGEWN